MKVRLGPEWKKAIEKLRARSTDRPTVIQTIGFALVDYDQEGRMRAVTGRIYATQAPADRARESIRANLERTQGKGAIIPSVARIEIV